MSRKPRIHVPGGFYHVILRGNGRNDIFFSVNDSKYFENLISEGKERFGHRIHLTRVSERTINYEFTVIDPGTYTGEWGGEVPMRALDGLIYEYACHEGNYALGNILSGARYQERMEAQDPAGR